MLDVVAIFECIRDGAIDGFGELGVDEGMLLADVRLIVELVSECGGLYTLEELILFGRDLVGKVYNFEEEITHEPIYQLFVVVFRKDQEYSIEEGGERLTPERYHFLVGQRMVEHFGGRSQLRGLFLVDFEWEKLGQELFDELTIFLA